MLAKSDTEIPLNEYFEYETLKLKRENVQLRMGKIQSTRLKESV